MRDHDHLHADPQPEPSPLKCEEPPLLDPIAAEAAAVDYLNRSGATGTATVSDASITVTVTRVQPMHILPLADRVITVRSTATAVDEPSP